MIFNIKLTILKYKWLFYAIVHFTNKYRLVLNFSFRRFWTGLFALFLVWFVIKKKTPDVGIYKAFGLDTNSFCLHQKITSANSHQSLQMACSCNQFERVPGKRKIIRFIRLVPLRIVDFAKKTLFVKYSIRNIWS